MSENKLLDLSIELSVLIVQIVDSINGGKNAYMTDQLARAGTSVGANIHEAQYTQSRRDFIHKMEIALKEANETAYWLVVLHQTGRITDDLFFCTDRLCGHVRRLLIATCKTAKEKQ